MVDWGVKEQQYMFDAAEVTSWWLYRPLNERTSALYPFGVKVESWMNEKRAALESDNYGQDEDAAQKLLAKHRALQKDMQTYRQ